MATHLLGDESVSPLTLDPESQAPWLEFSAAMGDIAAAVAGLDTLVVTVAPGAGHGSPACYLPNHAAIEIDGVHLDDVDPATAFPEDPDDQARFLPVMGLLAHECAHARHSVWSTPPGLAGTPAEEAALVLEEARVERAQLARRPEDLLWLRASATSLVLAEMRGHTVASPAAAGQAAALLLARRDAGVLTATETGSVLREVTDVLGLSAYQELHGIWRRAFTVADDDGETMLHLGALWAEALGLSPQEARTPTFGLPGAPGEATDSTSGDTVGSSKLSKAVEDALSAVAQSVVCTPTGAAAEANAAREAEKAARAQAVQVAVTVFRLAPETRSVTTEITGRRPPTEAEQAAARQFAQALNLAGSRERAVTRRTSALPPGRVRMRGALAAEAQRAAGQIPTAEPFIRTTRHHTPTPPLRVGIACDASSSMKSVVNAVASAAWILAKAAAHTTVPTRTAIVIFGELARPITKPDEVPAQVTLWRSTDGSHGAFPAAVDALDAGLDLSNPGAVRLLVVISDGDYSPDERQAGQGRVNRLLRHGCAVLWIAPKQTRNNPFDGVAAVELGDPAATMQVIGQAATAALRRASR